MDLEVPLKLAPRVTEDGDLEVGGIGESHLHRSTRRIELGVLWNGQELERRLLSGGDWQQVRRIYAEGLRTGLAAFTTGAPQWDGWDRGHLRVGRLVARDGDGRVAGWSALSPVPDT